LSAWCGRKYEFAVEEVEGFRYRARDAWRAATRVAVREARLRELRRDLLACRTLQVRLLFAFTRHTHFK
jgi:ATP-dependent RNA helicase DDX56/DBP9